MSAPPQPSDPVISQHDYYSYDPRGYLAAPVVLLCLPEGNACAIASLTSQRTGLPYTELSRWVEHKAGKSVRALLEEDGRTRTMRLYAEGLRVALTTPYALIAAPTFVALSFWSRFSLRSAHVFAVDDAASKVPWAVPFKRDASLRALSERLLSTLQSAGSYSAVPFAHSKRLPARR